MDPPELQHTGLGLRHHLDVVRRRKWIVLAVLAAAIGGAVAASLLREPLYRAETKIVVGQGNSLFAPGEANAVQPFTATMSDLVKSNVVADQVIERLQLARTPEEILDAVSVSFNPETAVLNVEVVDHDRATARSIADAIGGVFSQLVKERFGQPAASEPGLAQPPLTATVWDAAHVNPQQVSPKPLRDIVIAAALGLVLGLLVAFLRDYFDRTLRDRETVEESFGVPVIGQIPFFRRRRTGTVGEFWDGFREGAESFRGLRANLQYLAVQRPLRSILIASAAPAQGKTTVAANLAVAMAQSGARPVLVEGDLRRPRLHESLGFVPTGPGLTSVLVASADLDDAVTEVAAPGASEPIAVLPSGPLPPNPSELLSSAQMEVVLDQLADRFDYVLIDSPPLLLVADALELARMVDGVVLVVRRNHASTDEAREVRALTERLEIHMLGVVFTDAAPLAAYYGEYGEPAAELVPAAPRHSPRARAQAAREDEFV